MLRRQHHPGTGHRQSVVSVENKAEKPASYTFEMKVLPSVALFLILVVVVVAGYRLGNTPTRHAAATATAQAPPKQPVISEPTVPAPDPLASLASDMTAAMTSQSGLSASASVINLATGKEYDAGNYTSTYEAASTSKLVAVFDYIHQVEQGKASLSQSIQGQNAQDIIMRMIVYSDNDAWAKLNTYLHYPSGEQAYLDSIGVDGRMVPNNIQFSTPAMAKMLQLLYDGKLMNAEHQAMIYGYMSHTTVTNLVQAVLPAETVVYHKYGQIDGVLHDASIVEYRGRNFVLVVYTNNPAGTAGLYDQQVALIHAVATAAFNDLTAP
ncbi:MAG TPA: serine hydrolase [Candidatus Saccharimonadales bacterium]|nr:serine hydrolase [Candidatus Saccharimonadales bacterium]